MATSPLAGFERTKEHMDMLKEVWFKEFDETFALDFENLHSILLSSRTIHFTVEDGIDNGDIAIGLHPSMTKQHLYWLSKAVRLAFARNDNSLALNYVLMSNLSIELLEAGVLPSIARLYYIEKTGEDWHDVHFASYKEKEAVDESVQG